ncbi:TonB-dependent receptor [Glaciecola sp. XM2]|uniref:TonB-dependent receptor plug domain-containing protein n=1 Tax=Glaciecola sp. XM2 TaxID=1914931 RepID=UPI001BDE57CE|nr:TonB-dependent receptor [Glaciecola sp. XM2]MBT1452431.1 TonB-dependent receptor [Glaciecola sp. XM2]
MNHRRSPFNKFRILTCCFLTLWILLLTIIPVRAEQDTTSDTTISYSQDYFAQFQVVTLVDMIRVVPGGTAIFNSLDDGQQSRGLGATGAQILIDGKRMSGKANDMSTRLSRIQAEQVQRIDLIRGNAEGLDVRSQGVLINVILKSDASDDVIYFSELGLIFNNQQHARPQGLLNASARGEQFEFDVGLNHDLFLRVTDFTEDLMDAARNIQQIRTIHREFLRTTNSITTNMQYTFDDGDVLRFNGLYSEVNSNELNIEDQFALSSEIPFAEELLDISREDDIWEIGGDYETDLGAMGTLKTIIVSTKQTNTDQITQSRINNSQATRLFGFRENSDETEQIIRSNLTNQIFNDQTLELGVEAAFNELNALQSFNLGPFESSLIKEDRYELFATHSLNLTESMHFQTALIRESSTISQDAIGIENERTFNFWKPRLELRYDVDAKNQLRLVADRSVSQLNLRNFIATRNTDDDTINFGNPDLAPEKVWQYLIAYEHRLADDAGTIEIEIFKDEISDFITDTRNADGSSGTGNIGDAKRLGLNFEASGTLDFIGISGVQLTFTYQLRDTEMIDPFLNIERRLNGIPKETFLLDFRHDLKDLGIVYGFDLNRRTYRFDQNRTRSEIRTNIVDADVAYVEYSISSAMRLRLEVLRPFGDRESYDRTFFNGDISQGIIDRIEYRQRDVRPTYILTLQSTF